MLGLKGQYPIQARGRFDERLLPNLALRLKEQALHLYLRRQFHSVDARCGH